MEKVLDSDDLLMEIFVRFPAKTLISFKSVCKKWRDLISSDPFSNQHVLCCPKLQPSLILQIMCEKKRTSGDEQKRTLLFYLNPTIEGESVMIHYEPAVADYKILDACNGLWLLESVRCQSSHFAYYGPGHENCSLYVYNPTTRRSREISLPYSAEYPYLAEINLAFDPSKSHYYKIVSIWSTSNNSGGLYTYQIHVYDSKIETWNLCVEGLKYPRISYGVYWNNAIYWSPDDLDEECYYCFDMCRDEMKTMCFPEIPGAYRNCGYELQELNGHLYHIKTHVEEDDESETVQAWRLSEQSEWILDDYRSRNECEIFFGI